MGTLRQRKVRFQKKKGREPLTRDETEYWLDILPKTLKIGTEFEINLISPDRLLRIKDNEPCVESESPCHTDCANLDTCLSDRHPSLCLTRHSGKFLQRRFECPAKNDSDAKACQECKGWMLNCRGQDCAMHTPFCTVCPSFLRRGEVIESANLQMDAESVRKEMRDWFQPSQFVGEVGKSGVLSVTKDDSLDNGNGGIEVPTVGRRVHWQSFYNMCKGIIDPVVARGGTVNERCGQHFHVLTGYFDGKTIGKQISELEKPLPEIVLANFHQLHRRYELALFWMMSAGTSMNSITRWARFRQSIGRYSALQTRMEHVRKEMGEHIIGMNSASAVKGKYASTAYHFCKFNEEGQVSTFHIENRIADGALSPAVVTAWAMLNYALVLKAVRISGYGIMESGDPEFMSKIKAIKPTLIDGADREWGSNRFADTSGIEQSIPWLRETSHELIDWLKPELNGLGPSYQILSSLAENPCSLRLINGSSWENIEEQLYGAYKREQDLTPELDIQSLQEIVDLAYIMDCENIEMWVEEVAAYLGQRPPVIAATIEDMLDSGGYKWSEAIGTVITLS